MAKHIEVDAYVVDVLMRDLTGQEKRPSAFLVYLALWRRTRGTGEKRVALSYQDLSEACGVSKLAVQGVGPVLKARNLITVTLANPTAVPKYRVERPWVTHG